MRKLIIIAILGFGAYKAYGYFMQPPMAFDADGNPETLVFTFNDCAPCDAEIKLLKQRKIKFVEYNISTSTDNEKLLRDYGGRRILPYTVSGNRNLTGYQPDELVATLAEVHGEKVLTWSERRLMKMNFDASGKPIIVMYSTETCGYCKKAIQYFRDKGVPYVERDIRKNSAASQDYKALNGSGTPLIYVGYRRINGFDEKKVSAALDLL